MVGDPAARVETLSGISSEPVSEDAARSGSRENAVETTKPDDTEGMAHSAGKRRAPPGQAFRERMSARGGFVRAPAMPAPLASASPARSDARGLSCTRGAAPGARALAT